MPIVDSSRPSHSAPPFEPWLTGSGLLLLFWVGVIEMNGLVVAVTPNGWVGGAVVPGGVALDPERREVLQDRLAGGVGEPPRYGAGAARHRRVDRDRDDQPVGVDLGRAGVLRLRRRAAGDHDRSVVAAQLLVEGEHDRRRGLFERRPVLRLDRLERVGLVWAWAGSPVARTARVPNAPRRTVVSARWSTPEGFGRERSPLLTANTVAERNGRKSTSRRNGNATHSSDFAPVGHEGHASH